jgi:hypothetical protein
MNFPIKRRSEFDSLFRSRRKFPGWARGISVFVLVIVLVWYLYFERTADMPPNGIAAERAAAPARGKSKLKADQAEADDEESDDNSDSDDEDDANEDDTETESSS